MLSNKNQFFLLFFGDDWNYYYYQSILKYVFTHLMRHQVRVVFLHWMPCILRMKRPGRPYTLDYPLCSDSSSSERKQQPHMNDVELKERSSKSLLANVLDIDDDFRHTCRPMTPGGTLPPNPAYFRTVFGYVWFLGVYLRFSITIQIRAKALHQD